MNEYLFDESKWRASQARVMAAAAAFRRLVEGNDDERLAELRASLDKRMRAAQERYLERGYAAAGLAPVRAGEHLLSLEFMLKCGFTVGDLKRREQAQEE